MKWLLAIILIIGVITMNSVSADVNMRTVPNNAEGVIIQTPVSTIPPNISYVPSNNSIYWGGRYNESDLNHNLLGNLQGGSAGQYYHLNSSTYYALLSGLPTWIDNTVSNLVNYYTKSEIDGMIGNLSSQISNVNSSLTNYVYNVNITLSNQIYNLTYLYNEINQSLYGVNSTLVAQLSQEVLDRIANDTYLQDLINNITFVDNDTYLEIGIQNVNDTLNAEILNRIGNETEIRNILDTKLNITDQRYNDTALINSVNQSLTNYIFDVNLTVSSQMNNLSQTILQLNQSINNINTTIMSQLNQEILDRISNDSYIMNLVMNWSDNDTYLEQGIASINSSLSQEILDRIGNDTRLDLRIDGINQTLNAEIQDRINNDSALQGQINNLNNIILNLSMWAYNQTLPAMQYTDYLISIYNASWTSTYNATYATWAYNQTTPAIDYTNYIVTIYNDTWSTTYNATYDSALIWAYNQSQATYDMWNAVWSSTYNATYDKWAYNQTYSGSTYNSTYDQWAYNQTIPAMQYTDYLISVYNDSWMSTYNVTYDNALIWAYNQTAPAISYIDSIVSQNNASWLSTFNATYNLWAYNQTQPAIDYVDYVISINNGSWTSTFNVTYDNALIWAYNQTVPAIDYTNSIVTIYNATWSTTFNSTYDMWAYNQTLATYNLWNAVWSSTYNATYDKWAYNQTYSGSTYNSTYDKWAYNQTTPATDYVDYIISIYNSTWSSTYNATYDGALIWAYNQTAPAITFVETNYYNKSQSDARYLQNFTETDPLWSANASLVRYIAVLINSNEVNKTTGTYFVGQLLDAIIDALQSSILNLQSDKLNATDQRYNDTALINSVNISLSNQIGNLSQTILDNNATWSSTYNSTYDKWAYNQTYSGSTYNATYDMWAYNQTYTDYDLKVDSAPWLYNDTNYIYFNETYYNQSTRNLAKVKQFIEQKNLTTSSGSASGKTSSILGFLITKIIVYPGSNTTQYKFKAIESSSGAVIDQDRMTHTGVWSIEKNYAINDSVNLTITNSNPDDNFNVNIVYIDNFRP